MENRGVSEPIYSNTKGWFRYNYDIGRLEFLNNQTKTVVRIWRIPVDQWEALPSQQQYCENIVNQANEQQRRRREKQEKYQPIFVIALLVVVVCFVIMALELLGLKAFTLTFKIWPLTAISVAVAAWAYCKYKD